ncbi:MAG: leucine-rich repeat protein [Paramuribaculum sp.]|nr:leucine-rich repeat protein [Paramuribaculum sp.]
MKKLLLTILGLLSLLPALAQDFTFRHEDKTLKYTVLDADAKTVEVTGPADKNEMEGALIIPDKASDGTTEYTVVSIGKKAFYECSSLTSVTIPNSVTSIGFNAFSGCSGLTKAEFASIESLCSIKFGGSYANPLECAHNLYINGELIEDLVIPESVDSIGNYTFSGCSGLTSVTIPNSVTSIGESAFSGCSSLTSITLGEKLQEIRDFAFNECQNLKSVDIPNSVTSIGSYAFSGCSGLTSVTIPNSVKSIGYSAFYGCSGLKSVDIPNSVTSIGESAFVECFNLTKAEFASIESLCSIKFYGFSANPLSHAHNLYINGELIEDLVIPESVDSIGNYAFYGCSGLQSVSIPNSVKYIGSSAFCQCSGLTSIKIPNSVTSISDHTFSQCDGLTSVTIPNSVKSIGEAAFCGGSCLKSVSIPNSVTYIGSDAFSGCSGLTSVVIPNSITSIGESAFSWCSGLKSVDMPNSVTSIGKSAFYKCTALEKIVVPSSVKTIGEKAFYGDTSLSSIIIGHGLKKIGDEAFFDCPAKTVSITAQTPPEATATTFSNYNGRLYLQGQKAAEAYRNDPGCWSRFSSYLMVEPSEIKYDGKTTLYLKPGDQIQLTVTLMPDNVTLMQIFWSSTNPEIATVDENGLVTIHADTDNLSRASFTRSCKIIAESLYADGPVLEITINDTTSEVESIELNMTEAKITEGETIQLSVTPAEQAVTWASSDEAVATVDANGLVKAIKPGTATITATTSNNLTATCEVTVVAKPSGIEGVDGDDAPGVRVEGGEIVVDGKAEVFSITGSRVAVSDGGRISGLPHGIYIVRANGKTVKLRL